MSGRYKRKRISGNFSGGLKWGDIQAMTSFGGAYENISGYGDYHVKSNVLYSGATVPYIRNPSLTSNSTVISHKEYIGDIYTSDTAGAFKIQGFPINAGLAQTFEWLAQIAMNYEQYVVEGIIFAFRSMSCDALNSTNTALGTVIMATNYNVYNVPFASKAEMEGYEFSTSFKPSTSALHPVECSPLQTPNNELYVRTGAVPSGADQRLYDLGTFYIATVGGQAASVNIGELWVTYQVALLKPKLYQALGYGEVAYAAALVSVDSANPLGTSSSSVYNNSNIVIVGSTINFPIYPQPTRYAIRYRAVSTAAAAAVITLSLTSFNNCSQAFAANQTPAVGETATCMERYFVVQTNGGNNPSFCSINWSAAWQTAATTTAALRIVQVPNNY